MYLFVSCCSHSDNDNCLSQGHSAAAVESVFVQSIIVACLASTATMKDHFVLGIFSNYFLFFIRVTFSDVMQATFAKLFTWCVYIMSS